MRKCKPSDNLLEHIAGLAWALSFHLDTSVHGSIGISMFWTAARTPCFQNPKPSFGLRLGRCAVAILETRLV